MDNTLSFQFIFLGMTRMWLVDPEILCRQHLLGEHKELHQLLGHIEAENMGSIEGHAEKGQIDTSLIEKRHDKLVEEMKDRGFNHDSPLEYEDNLNLGEIDVDANIEDLIERCEGCRKRYEERKK